LEWIDRFRRFYLEQRIVFAMSRQQIADEVEGRLVTNSKDIEALRNGV
jgi:hypothetical protein